jgi:hypothetical protein
MLFEVFKSSAASRIYHWPGVIFIVACVGVYYGYLNETECEGYYINEETGTDMFNCSDVMAMANESWLTSIGCAEKFVPVDACPAGAQIVENWGGEGTACLNLSCCTVTRNAVIHAFKLTGITTKVIAACVVLLLAFSLMVKYEMNREPEGDKRCGYLMIIVALILALSVAGFGFWVFSGQNEELYSGDQFISGTVVDAGKVDPALLLSTKGGSDYESCFNT